METRRQPALTRFVQLRVEVTQGPDRGKVADASGAPLSVGTAADNDLILTDESVSRYHLEFRQTPSGIEISDLGSTNGTIIGRARIERAMLMPGAMIHLGNSVIRVIDGGVASPELLEQELYHGVVGRSPITQRFMAQLQKAAASDISVLLLGETGVGKEVAANAIHLGSARAEHEMETIDCGALAPTLIASELFGHEKGAFTGAERRHIGAFERAHLGTVFLDEVGELPLSLQTTLLGVLERRVFRRLGGEETLRTDVRLICATNRDLRAEVNSGRFRSDLYYRIAGLRIGIPPLRERLEDIPLLVESFLRHAGRDEPLEAVFPPQVLDQMMNYRWPGNVRELRNFVDHLFALGEAPELEDSRSGATPAPSSNQAGKSAIEENLATDPLLEGEYRTARDRMLASFEKLYLARLLERADGNVAEAARLSKINRTYLFEMLKRHGIRKR